MKLLRSALAALALLLVPAIGVAQTTTQATMGYQSGTNPRNLCVFDLSPAHDCVTVGTVDSTAHTFSGASASSVPWSGVTGTPTTIAGYGISVLPWANVTGTPTTVAGYGITALPWANVTGTPTTFSGYGITSGPASAITFTQNGAGAVATNLDTLNKVRKLYATDYMTAAQIADGTSRADALDVTVALNNCQTDAFAAGATCYTPAGTWNAGGGPSHNIPLVTNLITTSGGSFTANGIFFEGDSSGGTFIDLQANTSSNPPYIYEATGGPASLGGSTGVYGGIAGIHFLCNVAGPCVKLGQSSYNDYLNQMLFYNVSVQNFNATSASTCYEVNANYSSTAINVNCSTAAGPTGGNNLYSFRKVSFGSWNIGGSNGQVFLGMSSDVNAGNIFPAIDCEVVATCFTDNTANGVDNSFYGGTWSWNWGSTGANAVSETAGGDTAVFYPNQNANTSTGSAGSFLSSGSASFARLWNNSTIAPLASPTFTGVVTTPRLVLSGLTTGTNLYYLCLDAGGNVLISSGAC